MDRFEGVVIILNTDDRIKLINEITERILLTSHINNYDLANNIAREWVTKYCS